MISIDRTTAGRFTFSSLSRTYSCPCITAQKKSNEMQLMEHSMASVVADTKVRSRSDARFTSRYRSPRERAVYYTAPEGMSAKLTEASPRKREFKCDTNHQSQEADVTFITLDGSLPNKPPRRTLDADDNEK